MILYPGVSGARDVMGLLQIHGGASLSIRFLSPNFATPSESDCLTGQFRSLVNLLVKAEVVWTIGLCQCHVKYPGAGQDGDLPMLPYNYAMKVFRLLLHT